MIPVDVITLSHSISSLHIQEKKKKLGKNPINSSRVSNPSLYCHHTICPGTHNRENRDEDVAVVVENRLCVSHSTSAR